jgi:hypothetical protein
MDNDSVLNSKNTDEIDNDNSLQVEIGGMFTERKLGLINDAEAEMHPHEFSADQKSYI